MVDGKIHLVKSCKTGKVLVKQLVKRFKLEDKRQTASLSVLQLKIVESFFSEKFKTFNFLNLFGDPEAATENVWKTDQYLLKKISTIMKWYGIPVRFKIVNLTENRECSCLIKELLQGNYDVDKEEIVYHNVFSGNFEPVIIFVCPDEKFVKKYVLYMTCVVKDEEPHCWFCLKVYPTEMECFKCIHVNHRSLWNRCRCAVCGEKFTVNDQIHHYEFKHKLADLQYSCYLKIKTKLMGPKVPTWIEEENKDYKIMDSYKLVQKLNTSHVTIDISFDFETFTNAVEKGNAIPYMISLSMGCNFHYTHDTIPDTNAFKKKIKRSLRKHLTASQFHILSKEQERHFYLDDRYLPLVTAWYGVFPYFLRKKILDLQNTFARLHTTAISTEEYSKMNKSKLVTLHSVQHVVTEHFFSFLSDFLNEINELRYTHSDMFGEVEEVIVRASAYNGARFDNYFLEQYLKFSEIPKINRIFSSRSVQQGKDGIVKIAVRIRPKLYEDGVKRLKMSSNFKLMFEVVDIFKMKAPLSLEKQLQGAGIKDLKFKMRDTGHELMCKIALGLEKDLKLQLPTDSEEWKKTKVELLGRPKYGSGTSHGFLKVSVPANRETQHLGTLWDEEFEECLLAHNSLWNDGNYWVFSRYYMSYGVKDAVSCYALMVAMYDESREYLKLLYSEKLFDDLQRDPLSEDDDEDLVIKSLDFFKLAVSVSGLAFKIWHISNQTYVQPRGVAAATIRESIVGGFCQPQLIGEMKSTEDFCFYNNNFTQIDIVSMYANSQRSSFYATGTCQTGTDKVKESIDYCNRILQYPENIGLAQYVPIFGFYALSPPSPIDQCSLGPIACKIRLKEETNRWFNQGKKTTENVTWCGLPRFQALTPQDALTFKNLGWTIYMLDTEEAIGRTVLFETFGSPIKTFCEMHIKMKLDAKKVNNVAMEKLAKIIVNGHYGNTLMKPIHDRVLTIRSARELTKLYSDEYVGKISIKKVMECSYALLMPGSGKKIEDIYYIVKVSSNFAESVGPIHYGAQTLGHSHAAYFTMNEIVDPHKGFVHVKYRCPGQIYGDTDSWFVVNGVLKNCSTYKFGSIMSQMPENPLHNNEWCVIVEEKEPMGIHGNSCFICGKKSYCFITNDSEPHKVKDLLKVAKGQKLQDLRGEHYKQVVDKKMLGREKFEDLYGNNLKVETERLSFVKSLFAPEDQSPIVTTRLRRELQVNYTISGNHKLCHKEEKYVVKCVPHSVSEIEPNEKENIIESIEVLDSRSRIPELLDGYQKTNLPLNLHKACYSHYSECMTDSDVDIRSLPNGGVVICTYNKEVKTTQKKVDRFFSDAEDLSDGDSEEET